MALDPKDNGSQDPHANDASEHREDIGGDGSKDQPAKDGDGTHHTVWSEGGHRYSWETDKNGDYKEGSAHDNKNR